MENINKTSELAELRRQLAEALKLNEALKASKIKALSCKVSEKGAVSVYGLGRFPVTLYAEQWERVIDFSKSIQSFIAENKALLSVKQ